MARFLMLALAVIALAAAGCGGEDGGARLKGDPAAGKDVFASAGCGSCHIFEDAGTTGTEGPNLDESTASFDQAVEKITNGGGGMPSFEGQLSEQEIADVAAYATQSR